MSLESDLEFSRRRAPTRWDRRTPNRMYSHCFGCKQQQSLKKSQPATAWEGTTTECWQHALRGIKKNQFGCWHVFIFQCFIWEFVEAFWFCGMVLPVWAKSSSCSECSNDVKTNLAATFTSLRRTISIVLSLCSRCAANQFHCYLKKTKKNSPVRNHLWLVLKLIPLFTCNHSVRLFFFWRMIEYVSQENSVICLDLQTVNGRSCTKTKSVVPF